MRRSQAHTDMWDRKATVGGPCRRHGDRSNTRFEEADGVRVGCPHRGEREVNRGAPS